MSHLRPLRRLSKTMDLEIKCFIRTPFWSLLSLSSEVIIEAVVFILGYILQNVIGSSKQSSPLEV
jgi:hypothetical protein